ncbi:MAG: hypothetical protein H6655_18070 [Ardenticatenaceae bacterium]|nr:hypothetical protein [Ardenticatenaceae bacterium]
MRRWTIFLLLLLCLSVACQTEEPTAVGFLRGDFAFIPYQERVQIIDISDLSEPEFVTEISLPGNVAKVVANGRYLYIAHSANTSSWTNEGGPPGAGLQIVDVSDPTQPHKLGYFHSKSLPTDLLLHGDLVYLATWEFIDIVDVTDRDAPRQLGMFSEGATSLAYADNQLAAGFGGCSFRSGYCTGGLHLYDLAEPERPSLIGRLQLDNIPGYDVALANGLAVGTGKGLWITELANVENLQVNGRDFLDNGWLYAAQVLLDDHLAYVTQYDGLHIMDISQPTNPTLIGYFPTANQLTDLVLRDGRLYLTGWSGLEILDVTDPATPQLLGYYATEYPAQIFPQPTATP